MPGIDRFLDSPVRGSSGSATGRGSSPLDGFDGLGTEEPLAIDPSLQAASRKRPAEDMAQYAEAAARNVRLKPDAKEELLKFAGASGQEQGIWLAARLLAQEERLDTIQPAESVYHMSQKLQGKLDKTCFLVLVDHTIPAYLTSDIPVKRVQTHLEKYPSFGWTAEIKADKTKTKVILTRVRTKLTHGRNNIKNLLEKSIGTVDADGVRHDYVDLYKLASNILGLGSRVAPDTKLSLDFCVRVALLRAKVQESPGQDYWNKVDEYLEQVRVKKDNNAVRIAEVFGQIYDQDILQFDVTPDRKELEALSSVRPEVFVDEP
ncbi:hypothetical protein B0H14DRAFT_1443423 [Mycena olivaceomarginata]|nr:hypothetical protein B0H14DRAFT_1443423 [Mycena olivaceomarginata]